MLLPSGFAAQNLKGILRFVNLRSNMDDPLSAMAVARSLLAAKQSVRPVEILTGDTSWGELTPVPQDRLTSESWAYTAFTQSWLTETSVSLMQESTAETLHLPLAPLEDQCALGPYHMQIKNPQQGLFTIGETTDPSRLGEPALWHHKSTQITTLQTAANARLYSRDDRNSQGQAQMLSRAGRVHLASELRHAPQRLAAVLTDEPMLGVRSWITLRPYDKRPGVEQALCLWLNSSLGLLLRIAHANRPYLGRSSLPHEKARTLLVLNTRKLSDEQLGHAVDLFESLKSKSLGVSLT